MKRFLQTKKEHFEGTGNLAGDFQEDLKRSSGNKSLTQLLTTFPEIFGPLPPPGQGRQIVTLDIELKEEFQNTPLRGKCFPMPAKDVEEIEKQAQELVESGMVGILGLEILVLLENRKGVQKVVADEFHPQNARKTPSQVLLGNPE